MGGDGQAPRERGAQERQHVEPGAARRLELQRRGDQQRGDGAGVPAGARPDEQDDERDADGRAGDAQLQAANSLFRRPASLIRMPLPSVGAQPAEATLPPRVGLQRLFQFSGPKSGQ